jgi:hypothetical protein
LTLKISRRNWRASARRSARLGAVSYPIAFRPSLNAIYRLTLQKKADGDLFVVDTKGDDKGIHSRHLPIVAISYPYFSFLSSKIFATLLPHYPEITPNNISALCCPRCLCTPSTISRQSTRKRAAAQNRTEGSQRSSE